jgi:hypothetical protein
MKAVELPTVSATCAVSFATLSPVITATDSLIIAPGSVQLQSIGQSPNLNLE